MAKTSLIVKQQRLETKRLAALESWNKMKNIAKYYNRCKLCGRSHGYIRDFGVCRVCFRKYAREWLIVGLRKASW